MGFITKHGFGIVRTVAVALIALALLAPLMSAPAVRAAATQYVGTTADDAGTATDCTSPARNCTLRDALNAAAPGAVVALPPGNAVTYAVTLTYGPLIVGKDYVTIEGGGLLTVDGGGTGRVFQIYGAAAAMEGVTIQNGLASDVGGGINEVAGSLTLTGCLVTNNVAFSATGNAMGGGIYAQSDLTLIGTTVSHNDVGNAAATGNVFVFGGGIASIGGTLTVAGSTIAANETHTPTNPGADAYGAGIYTQGALAMTNSTVSDNVGFGQIQNNQGGGIFLNSSGPATIVASTIARNTAAGSGGGISNQSTLGPELADTLVAGNSSPDFYTVVGAVGRNNLIGDGSGNLDPANDNVRGDPGLDPAGLQANGATGPRTIALLRTSPAIEAGGACPAGVAADERGLPRAGACDIGAYEFQPATPTVADAASPATGGAVTFRGTGFQTGTRLTVGATSFTAASADVSPDGTQMTLNVPAHAAGPVAVPVVNPGGGHAGAGTLTYRPVVAGLSPGSGATAGGGTVTITGVGFAAGATSAMFGTTPAAVTATTATTATVTVPAHAAGTVDVTVTVNGAAGTLAGGYTYVTVAPLPTARAAGPPVGGGSAPSPLPPTRP